MTISVASRACPRLAASLRIGGGIVVRTGSHARPAVSLPYRRCLTSTTVRTFQQSLRRADESARGANERDQRVQEDQVKAGLAETTKHQIRRPWHRETADQPPVSQSRRDMNKNMTKGRLLTTPTRLLKLVLPLPFDALHDEQGNRGEFRSLGQNEDIEPLALLVHPQQPLSYLERLIQAEMPSVTDSNGREKIPNVYFSAEGSGRDETPARTRKNAPHVSSYSGQGREGAETAPEHKDWVRWSSSTEIGDFIRDAARGREFAVTIDGFEDDIRVGVPSFNDRTHYMRMRLRRMSRRIEQLSQLKQECDLIAHRGANRLAKAGFGALAAWWGTVYFVTFHTDAGWDLVEPVTYLAGLTTIMGGYLWFLFISRDISYQAALKITVSRRQNVLYQARGFDVAQWEAMVNDANSLRREIRVVAEEYDVDYDEARDLGGEEIKEVLEQEEKGRKKKGDEGDADNEDDDRSGSDKKERSKKD